MAEFNEKFRTAIMYCTAAFLGLVSLFFVFYEFRLFYITKGLTEIRTGGEGAYIGAVVFPVMAFGFGYLARIFFKRSRTSKHH